jgi:hypothetical protein
LLPRKKLDVPNDFLPRRDGPRDGRVTRGPSNGHARARNNEFGVAEEGVKAGSAPGAGKALDVGMDSLKFVETGWMVTAVGDSQMSAHAFPPSDDGESGVSRTQNKNFFVMPAHLAASSSQRSFKVDRPNRTNIIVMIQNLTTT